MTKISVLDPASSHLLAVRNLWKSNNKYLGRFPKGAFEERARRGTILIALSPTGDLLGYLLYYINQSRIANITHLCVSRTARQQGTASLLVSELKTRTKHLHSIGATCRRDFPAWKVWGKLGFVAIASIVGRGKKPSTLTRFVFSHKHESLYDDITESGIRVAIDANILFDIEDPSRHGAKETKGLLDDWLSPLIRLCVTQEMLNELHGVDSTLDPNRRLRLFEILSSDPDRFDDVQSELKGILGLPKSDQDSADQRHIARAVTSNVGVFVTRDSSLLRHSTAIFQKYGLRVVRPSRLISDFDQIENETAYQRDRLSGTSLRLGVYKGDIGRFSDAFFLQQCDHNLASFQQLFGEWQANPKEVRIHTVTEGHGDDEQLLAAFVMRTTGDGRAEVPLVRVANELNPSRIFSTLQQGVFTALLKTAVESKSWLIEISSSANVADFLLRCRDLGFRKDGSVWKKVALRGAANPPVHAARLSERLRTVGGERAFEQSVVERLKAEELLLDSDAAFECEQLIWPAKITGCGIRAFIIPIRPNWAKHLIDAGLGADDLFGSDIDLVLNFEAIYYRSPIPGIVNGKSRVIWYVSNPKRKYHGYGGFVRACSLIESVEVDTAKRAFKRYQRFGVYGWKDVFVTAKNDKDGKVMAVKFGHTEKLRTPTAW